MNREEIDEKLSTISSLLRQMDSTDNMRKIKNYIALARLNVADLRIFLRSKIDYESK